jgi:RNA-directed DNA polymerase
MLTERQRAERNGYVREHRSFNRIWKKRDRAEPDIPGKILDRDKLNRGNKR